MFRKIKRRTAKLARKIVRKVARFRLTPELVATIYTLNLMVGFQILIHNLYYDIQDFKLYYFVFSTAGALGIILIIYLVRLIGRTLKKVGEKEASLATGDVQTVSDLQTTMSTQVIADAQAIADARITADTGTKVVVQEKRPIPIRLRDFIFGWIKDLTVPEKFGLGFIIVIIFSTFGSKYLFEAFWGNLGRYQGLYAWLFYAAGYFIISRHFSPKKWHFDVLLLASLITSVWAILDYYWLSPVNWQNISGGDAIFRSAFGNIDSTGWYHGLVLALSTTLFVCHKEEKRGWAIWRTIFYGLVSAVAFMAIVTEGADLTLLSVGVVVCFLPFVAFGSMRSIIRYVAALGLWLVTPFAIRLGEDLTVQHLTGAGVLYDVFVVHLDLTAYLLAADVAVVAILLIISKALKSRINEKKVARVLRIIWGTLGVLTACALIYILYDANTGGHEDLYAPYSNFLIFNYSWGAGRGYIWNLAFRYIRNFNLWQWFFGTGPETFYAYTLEFTYAEIRNQGTLMYDSTHSEFIQYLMTTGVLGCIAYNGWMVTAAYRGIKTQLKNANYLAAYAGGCAFAVIAHFFSSSVNISSPTTYPLFILFIGLAAAASREMSQSEAVTQAIDTAAEDIANDELGEDASSYTWEDPAGGASSLVGESPKTDAGGADQTATEDPAILAPCR